MTTRSELYRFPASDCIFSRDLSTYIFLLLVSTIIPGTRSIISGSLSYIVLGSFELDYSTRTVSFTYILLSICATLFAACPVDTSEMVVSGVSGAGAGYVAVVIWFGTFTFKVFSFEWLVFFCGIRFL